MCDPLTIASAALQGVSSISAINAQNKASAENEAAAKQALNDENAQTDAQYVERNRSLIQEGFDAVLAGRAAESTAYASAIENGVQGSSIKSVLRDNRVRVGRSGSRTKAEQDSLKTQVRTSYTQARSKAEGRIASVPRTSFGFGDVAGILAPIVKSQL
jgi:hypothetical protein